MFACLFTILGVLSLIKLVLYTYDFIYVVFLMKKKNLQERYGKKSWVVVTGGSEGIGWEIVKQWAADEFNIIMIARNEKKLQEKKDELKTLYKDVECLTLSYDLGNMRTHADFEELISKFGDRDVSVVVNNAGVMIGMLDQNSPDFIMSTTSLNLMPIFMFTRYMVEKYYQRKQRSAFVNVGSLFSEFPSFNNSIYASTKAAVKQFTIGEAQNHSDKIDFLCLQPGFTATKMMNHKSNWLFGGHPDVAARECLRSLGNRVCTQGDVRHVFLIWLIDSLKNIIPLFIVQQINDFVFFFILGFSKNSKTLMDPKVERTGFVAKLEKSISGLFNSESKKKI